MSKDNVKRAKEDIENKRLTGQAATGTDYYGNSMASGGRYKKALSELLKDDRENAKKKNAIKKVNSILNK